MRTHRPFAIVLLALAAAGCSISASSWSLSKSSGSSADSSGKSADSSGKSSESSSPGEAKSDVYRDDVRDQTAAYVESGGGLDAFRSTLGQVARRHGITDWEASRATYVGIGEGLAKARVSGGALDAFEAGIVGTDPTRRDAVRAGYETARR